MADKKNTTLECATYYISQRWQVLPLHTIVNGKCTCKTPSCESPGKHPYSPLVPNGSKDATTNRQTIEQWFNGKTPLNIGICAGKNSGLVLLDVDPEHGGRESLKTYPKITDTLEVTTGSGGSHYYFRHPQNQEVRNSAGKLGPGLDVRGHHGYVVAPPSKHISGGTYKWVIDPRAVELSTCPEWIITSNTKQKNLNTESSQLITKGRRDNFLTSFAGTMRRRGASAKSIYAALVEENKTRCQPPLPDNDLKRIANSIAQRPPKKKEEKQKSIIKPNIIIMADVKAIRQEWLWHHRIPDGGLSLLVGNPGLGKSVVTMFLAAQVTTGAPWPDRPNEYHTPGSVVLLTCEDRKDSTIKPRLEAAKADQTKIAKLESVTVFDTEQEVADEDKHFNIDQHSEALIETIYGMKDTKLVIIDPVTGYLGRNTDSHKNAETRRVLSKLGKIAEDLDVAIIGVSHLNKNCNTSAIYRVIGSVAFNAIARAVWYVVEDSDSDERGGRLFLPGKNNLAPNPTGLRFELKTAYVNIPNDDPAETVYCDFDGDPVNTTADEALTANTTNQKDGKSKIEEAQEFLYTELNCGPVSSGQVWKNAKSLGIAPSTLKRAMEKLGVKNKKEGFRNGWTMELDQNTPI
jgi:hypothetical protein